MTSQPVSAQTAAPESPTPPSPQGNGAPPAAGPAPSPNGSPSRGPSLASRARGWTTRTKLLLALGALAALVVLGAGTVYAVRLPFRSARPDLVTQKAEYG